MDIVEMDEDCKKIQIIHVIVCNRGSLPHYLEKVQLARSPIKRTTGLSLLIVGSRMLGCSISGMQDLGLINS